MIQDINAIVIVLVENQYYELKLQRFMVAETPEGTKVEIVGTVKDEDWVGYAVNSSN